MARLLLLLENKQNRALLASWLSQRYQIITPETIELSNGGGQFDLCLIDGPTLDRRWVEVRTWKEEQEPIFLPVILLTSHREVELITRHLWKSIDELIRLPIEKMELQARVEMLLRTRTLSSELKMRNEDLESFFHAMTHDLRAPLRAIKGFAEFLDEGSESLSTSGRHYLSRIQGATSQMEEIIGALVAFARVGSSEGAQLQALELDVLLERCVKRMHDEIEQHNASVRLETSPCVVEGHSFLFKTAFTNLLSNALKFVKRGEKAEIIVRSQASGNMCRLEVEDNGIGIAPDDQARLFKPFSQLHSVEEYEGIGLGLATVRKAVELMGGHVGVHSTPGKGSLFWIELRLIAKGNL